MGPAAADGDAAAPNTPGQPLVSETPTKTLLVTAAAGAEACPLSRTLTIPAPITPALSTTLLMPSPSEGHGKPADAAPAAPAASPTRPPQPAEQPAVPAKKPKKKIVPKHVAQISAWTVPRRPFQPVLTVQDGGGLRMGMLNLDEGDTSDLLDSTTEDGTSKRSTEDCTLDSTQSFPQPAAKRQRIATTPKANPSSAATTPQHPPPPSPRPSPLQTKAAGPTTMLSRFTSSAAALSTPGAPPPVSISQAHLRAVAALGEAEATTAGIPLSFWGSCRHAMQQYTEWCDTERASDASVALHKHETKLIGLIEQSLCGATRLTRRRLRRESAVHQLALGLAPERTARWQQQQQQPPQQQQQQQPQPRSVRGIRTDLPDASEGLRFQTLRQVLADMEDRKKALEASINARAKASGDGDEGFSGLLNSTGDAQGVTEPAYIQDGAERLELQFLRKEQSDKQKELERLEAERLAATRQHRLFKSEDASLWRGFSVLDNRYLMLQLLGKGGYSEVWKAFDRLDTEFVAVKVHRLSEAWSDDKKANYIRHARRETEIQKGLHHPNIVPLKDCFDIDGSSFATVMECTDGEDVATYQEKHGPFRERDARVIIRQVLSALQYIHDPKHGRKIIHYDLKPGNMLLFGDLDIRITDFGLSKIMDCDKDDIELTTHGAGTLWYLPPECFSTSESARITPAVDVWSAGVVLFQLLYNKKPFGDGMSQRALLHNNTIQGTASQLDLPSQPKVSKATADMIRRMLSYRPADRPSVASLLQEFDADDAHDGHDDVKDDTGMPPPAARKRSPPTGPRH
eukprot:TRINITY_DN5681_c3_g1_i1.p1 TRINITY_DN5681_c3_g1~~TRINITY_DN5681_c3_g1_i1.p1  ORF type:complete len:822 (+),score=268.49 TRINITY_DN5681_c3_g1_i1:68-2467(+)